MFPSHWPVLDAVSWRGDCPGRVWRELSSYRQKVTRCPGLGRCCQLPPCPAPLSRSPGQHLTEVQVQTSARPWPCVMTCANVSCSGTVDPATPGTPGADHVQCAVTPDCDIGEEGEARAGPWVCQGQARTVWAPRVTWTRVLTQTGSHITTLTSWEIFR